MKVFVVGRRVPGDARRAARMPEGAVCAAVLELSDDGRGRWPGAPRLRLQHLQERCGEGRPVLTSKRDELAYQWGLEATDCGVESVWDDVVGYDRDAESGRGEVSGCGDLTSLDGSARREPRARTGFEDEL